MAWAKAQEKKLDPSQWIEERLWISAYADSQDAWIKNFAQYEIVGIYEIEENLNLYRFRIDESRRDELPDGAARYHSVVIKHVPPPPEEAS